MNNSLTEAFSGLDTVFAAAHSSIPSTSPIELIVILLISSICGIFIYLAYKKCYRGVAYSESFALTLVAIVVIMSVIVVTIKGNLVLSLGMVGALSIVRYRTPIKDPVDLAFIFWSIASGLSTGVGMFHITLIANIFILVLMVSLFYWKKSSGSKIIIVRDLGAKLRTLKELDKLVTDNFDRPVLKNFGAMGNDLVYSVRQGSTFIEQVEKLQKKQIRVVILSTEDDILST